MLVLRVKVKGLVLGLGLLFLISYSRPPSDTPLPLNACDVKISSWHTQVQSLTDAVVTDAAVGGTRGPEDLAGVAVLQLHDLVVDLDVTDAWRGPLARRDIPICCLCSKNYKLKVSFNSSFDINISTFVKISSQTKV